MNGPAKESHNRSEKGVWSAFLIKLRRYYKNIRHRSSLWFYSYIMLKGQMKVLRTLPEGTDVSSVFTSVHNSYSVKT